MEIIFHAHHANVSDRMRKRAESAVRTAGLRLKRTVDAIIRFEQDGPVKRVEIMLHAPRQKGLIARAEGKYFGPVFTSALERLSTQIRRLTATRRTARRLPPAEKPATA